MHTQKSYIYVLYRVYKRNFPIRGNLTLNFFLFTNVTVVRWISFCIVLA